MLLEKIIRQPNSLQEAEKIFLDYAKDNGYTVGEVYSYWQSNLFSENDVIVWSKCRKA